LALDVRAARQTRLGFSTCHNRDCFGSRAVTMNSADIARSTWSKIEAEAKDKFDRGGDVF
jgi:hypothetical protein